MIQRTLGWAPACAIATAVLFAPSAASADGVVELSWVAPPECPTRAAVEREVERLVVSPPPEQLFVKATVQRTAAQSWNVTLTMTGAVEGKRSLDADSCAGVAQATAMIIALAVDPEAGAPKSKGDSSKAPLGTTGDSEAEEKVEAEQAGEEERRRATDDLSSLVRAGAVLEGAILPKHGWGVEFGGGLQWRWLSADLSLGLVPRVSASLLGESDVGGDFLLGWLGLRGCVGQDFTAIGLHACGAFRPSLLRWAGTGATQNFEGTVLVPALSVGGLLRVPGTSRWGAELTAGVTAPLDKPSFVIERGPSESREAVFQPGTGASFGLSFYYRL